jgi:hypothetical protein
MRNCIDYSNKNAIGLRHPLHCLVLKAVSKTTQLIKNQKETEYVRSWEKKRENLEFIYNLYGEVTGTQTLSSVRLLHTWKLTPAKINRNG